MRTLKSFLLLAAVFLALLVPAQAGEASGPNLWKVGDEDTTVYIFGTIHILNKDVEWFTPQLQQAFQEAGTLVLELAPDQEDPAILNPLIGKYGLLPAGETLQTRLSEEEYANMVGVLEGMGAQGNALDTLQPWLAATFLTVQVAATYGFLPDYGVDKILQQTAADRDIPIYGLETAEYQISLLAGLSAENQKKFLSLTLEELNDIEEFFVEMRDAWLAGDSETLDALINRGFDEMPEFFEALLYQRNRNWVGEIDIMLEEPGIFLMAVGAGHLVGEQNLLELLQAGGLEVTLVQ